MSKISNIIFDNEYHYITSPFGLRTINGKLNNHQGTDYGTKGKKLPQYAIEDGYVFQSAKSTRDGAFYVWVIYPRIKKAFLHYHLDKYSATSKKSVTKGTLLGYTGKTGYATGIHLHLGIRDLSKLSSSQVKNMTWASLRACPYIDPEAYAKRYSLNPYDDPDRVLKLRAKGEDVKWLQWELNRLGYYLGDDGIDGRLGPITTNSVKKFQREHKDVYGRQLVDDGFVGPLTVGALKIA